MWQHYALIESFLWAGIIQYHPLSDARSDTELAQGQPSNHERPLTYHNELCGQAVAVMFCRSNMSNALKNLFLFILIYSFLHLLI